MTPNKFFAAALALPLLALPVSTYSATELDNVAPRCKTGKIWNFARKRCMDADDIDSGKASAKKNPPIKCVGKRVWNAKRKRCVADEKSSSLDQETIYTYGRDLARAGKFDDALRVLYLVPDQNDPRVLNYLGYTNRKLGNMDTALEYYHAAVASNPNFTLVREYLGEAYIQLGQLEKAREQLTHLERICGNNTCREYSMLAKYMVDSQLQ